MLRRSGVAFVTVSVSVIVIVIVIALAGLPVAGAPCWPPPVTATVVDPFRAPSCPWCPGNRGIEYATVPGSSVRAVASGRVTFAGRVAHVRYVVVEIASGWRITYGRLAETALRRGDRVVAGAIVGTSGDRLHLGVRDGDRYLDPAPHLGRWWFRPRLVPADGSPDAGPGAPQLRCGQSTRSAVPARGGIGRVPR